MIVATAVMIVTMLVLIPIPFRVFGAIDLDALTAKLVVKIGFLRIFALNLYLQGTKIVYAGTINGVVGETAKGSSLKFNNICWDQVSFASIVRVDFDCLTAMAALNVASGVAVALLQQRGVVCRSKVALGDKVEFSVAAKCKVSLLGIVGV